VADATKRLHPGERDSHFNPVDKVKFEKALAATLLANAHLYSSQVAIVSEKILGYFETRLAQGVAKGEADAHSKYVQDLAKLSLENQPGWWGAVHVELSTAKEQVALQTKQALRQGTLSQKLAVHQKMAEHVLISDFKSQVGQAVLGASALVPWYVRERTKLKDGKLDLINGTAVFADKSDPNYKKIESERARVKMPDTKAVGPAGTGIEARNDTGAAPLPVAGMTDTQQVYRGADSFTIDEAKAFAQRARLIINMPLAAGVSGSSAELLNCAMTLGVTGSQLQQYAIAVLAYVGGGGNHSYNEIVIVMKAAELDIDPDNYDGVEKLIGSVLFSKLKAEHPNAFKDAVKPATLGTET
jgi:hypothetical protein